MPLVPLVPFDTLGTYTEKIHKAKMKDKAKKDKLKKPDVTDLTSSVLDALYEQGIGSFKVLPSGEKTRKRDLKLERKTEIVIEKVKKENKLKKEREAREAGTVRISVPRCALNANFDDYSLSKWRLRDH